MLICRLGQEKIGLFGWGGEGVGDEVRGGPEGRGRNYKILIIYFVIGASCRTLQSNIFQ